MATSTNPATSQSTGKYRLKGLQVRRFRYHSLPPIDVDLINRSAKSVSSSNPPWYPQDCPRSPCRQEPGNHRKASMSIFDPTKYGVHPMYTQCQLPYDFKCKLWCKACKHPFDIKSEVGQCITLISLELTECDAPAVAGIPYPGEDATSETFFPFYCPNLKHAPTLCTKKLWVYACTPDKPFPIEQEAECKACHTEYEILGRPKAGNVTPRSSTSSLRSYSRTLSRSTTNLSGSAAQQPPAGTHQPMLATASDFQRPGSNGQNTASQSRQCIQESRPAGQAATRPPPLLPQPAGLTKRSATKPGSHMGNNKKSAPKGDRCSMM